MPFGWPVFIGYFFLKLVNYHSTYVFDLTKYIIQLIILYSVVHKVKFGQAAKSVVLLQYYCVLQDSPFLILLFRNDVDLKINIIVGIPPPHLRPPTPPPSTV